MSGDKLSSLVETTDLSAPGLFQLAFLHGRYRGGGRPTARAETQAGGAFGVRSDDVRMWRTFAVQRRCARWKLLAILKGNRIDGDVALAGGATIKVERAVKGVPPGNQTYADR